jgi:hypothetical protein
MNARRSLLFGLSIVLALSACAPRGRRELPPPGGVTPAPEGIKFTLKVKPPRFRPGQRVVLEATLFNESEKSFERKFPTSCVWDYELATAGGRIVGPARTCAEPGETLHLEPGELRMIMREWGGRDRYFDAVEPLQPGTYRLSAGFIDETHRVVSMADPVTIEVLP